MRKLALLVLVSVLLFNTPGFGFGGDGPPDGSDHLKVTIEKIYLLGLSKGAILVTYKSDNILKTAELTKESDVSNQMYQTLLSAHLNNKPITIVIIPAENDKESDKIIVVEISN